jgi:hypothetical protein
MSRVLADRAPLKWLPMNRVLTKWIVGFAVARFGRVLLTRLVRSASIRPVRQTGAPR